MAAMRHAPHGLLESLHQLGEAANVPYVGHPENNIFPNAQFNIATPVPEEIGKHIFLCMDGHRMLRIIGKGGDLSRSLGSFGGPHLDSLDSASSLTAMTNLSLLPPEVDPGCFHLFELGVCWALPPISTIIFSCLRWHGGCSPTHKRNWQPPSHAYRLCLVSYPTSSIIDGGTEAAFSAIPDKRGGLFTIPREV